MISFATPPLNMKIMIGNIIVQRLAKGIHKDALINNKHRKRSRDEVRSQFRPMPHDRHATRIGAPDWPRMPPLTTQVAIREDGQMTWCGELHFGITRGNLLVIHGIRPKSAKGLPKSLHASLPYLPLIGRFSGITDNRNPCMPPRHALLAARVVATWWAV